MPQGGMYAPPAMHFTTVSGFTTSKISAHLDQSRRSASQNGRSHPCNLGRGFLRLSTPTC